MAITRWARRVPLAALLLAAGCAALSRQVDRWALQQKARLVASQGPVAADKPPLPYQSGEELERLTRPSGLPQVRVGPLQRHRLDDPFMVQEELTFASAIKLRFAEADEARAYVYRTGPLGERPALLYVPGQNFTERDFGGLAPFLERVAARGVDVVFFVPPYHLDRTPPGFGSGDAMLATDFVDHLDAFAQELSDLRALAAWLRAQGVAVLGAFGGSMGGGLVLRLAGWEPLFDFVTALQPVLDFDEVLQRAEMAPVRARLEEQGYGAEEVARAYDALDPRGAAGPGIERARISVIYGRFDLIAPEGPILDLARRWQVARVRALDRGHALFSLGALPAREMAASLEEDLFALRWRCHPRADHGVPRAQR